jgi:hypothetical protein
MKREIDEWKKLCELVANETDPQKLSKHLDRLIQALDARRHALHGTQQVKPPSGSTEGEK